MRDPKTGIVSEIDCPFYRNYGRIMCKSWLGLLDLLNCPPAERKFKPIKKLEEDG